MEIAGLHCSGIYIFPCKSYRVTEYWFGSSCSRLAYCTSGFEFQLHAVHKFAGISNPVEIIKGVTEEFVLKCVPHSLPHTTLCTHCGVVQNASVAFVGFEIDASNKVSHLTPIESIGAFDPCSSSAFFFVTISIQTRGL